MEWVLTQTRFTEEEPSRKVSHLSRAVQPEAEMGLGRKSLTGSQTLTDTGSLAGERGALRGR